MKTKKYLFPKILTALVISSTTAVSALAQFYPDGGDICYDGVYLADSYFQFIRPDSWLDSNPGYEHDFVVPANFFQNCTSVTNLPDSYDDCNTGGVFDGDQWSFSFGSYDAKQLQAYTIYYGGWRFVKSGGPVTGTFGINSQEVSHQLCPFDNPWCMGAEQTKRVISGYITWGGYPSCMAW